MVLSDIVLPCMVPAHLQHIQTAADFPETKNVYSKGDAREQGQEEDTDRRPPGPA
jgi:hypothetical protein